jgi:hydrogenase maturation protein HypF
MARTLEALERVVALDAPARAALLAPARPIVLAPARVGNGVAPDVAPGLGELGVFLPSTPLQHLLLGDGPPLLVMTSGNLSDEPIARTDAEALAHLIGVADAFLLHDREIHTRADDSVVRVTAGEARVVRRARGLVPDAIALPFDGPPVLAVGGELRATICVTRGREAILSQHLGDLDHAGTFDFFTETAGKLAALAGAAAAPRAVAHDLHPDYRSTRWAQARGLAAVAVQHHHAHVASCLCEHGRTGPVLGVAFDGTGLGSDGTLWGGEILHADLGAFRRLGHLRPIALPGGEAAIRQPWRLAAAALRDAGLPLGPLGARAGVAAERLDAVARLCDSPRLAPRATGAGRWFDAVAALCGVRAEISYDGQAAVELEAAAAPAARSGACRPYPVLLQPGAPFVIDLRPAVRAMADDLARGAGAAVVSARFHATLAHAVAQACAHARAAGAPGTVALTGGCFQNRLLAEATRDQLEALGFEVLLHRRVPCNDGGLALGQAAIASFRLAREASPSCA